MKPDKPKRTPEEQRHYNMSRIKAKNTSIEIILRRCLWHEGIRYRKNYCALPGTPDIAIPRYHIAIFCDGEFWHGKDWDKRKPELRGNREYWIAKIERNMARDREAERQLRILGWQVLRFWGDEIRKSPGSCLRQIEEAILESKLEE